MQRSRKPQALRQLLLAHSWHAPSVNFGEDTMNERPQQKNNQCLDTALLVSLRDEELSADEATQARAHLAGCPDCAADERTLIVTGQEVYDLLAELGPQTNETPDTEMAFASMQARLDRENDHVKRPILLPSPALAGNRPRHSQGSKRR